MFWLFALAQIFLSFLCLYAEEKETSLGLPNISDQTNSCSISTDVLLWSTGASSSENWAQVFSPPSSDETIDLLAVPFGWDPGIRVGLNYRLSHDQWDAQWFYTWYRSEGKDRASSEGTIHSPFIGNFYIGNPDGSADTGPAYHEAKIRWAILFNVFDWELGRKYWVSCNLSLRPFFGLKGGWVHQSIYSTWKQPTTDSFHSATENIVNNFWGLGPSFGLNSRWKFKTFRSGSIGFFADLAGALMGGRWTFKDIYQNDAGQIVKPLMPSQTSAAGMLRNFMGLSWESDHFSLRFGYEAQAWLDQLKYYSLNVGWLDNALTLQGGSFDVHFAF